MNDLSTIKVLNDTLAQNAIDRLVPDNAPPSRLGQFYVHGRGYTLAIDEASRWTWGKTPLLFIEYKGVRADSKKPVNVFWVRTRLELKMSRPAGTKDHGLVTKTQLLKIAATVGVFGLAPTLKSHFGA